MLRLGRHASLACALALLASCSSLVGLDDLEPDDADAGAAGRVIEPMTGGTKNEGGTAGSGEEGGAGAEGPKGEAGEGGGGAPNGGTSGSGGTAGTAGEGGTSGSGGTGGIVIPDDCPEVTVTYDTASNDLDEENSVFEFSVSPDIAGPGPDILAVEFYWYSGLDGRATGTFQIDDSDDAQFASCARCIRIQDQAHKDYLAVGGTVVVDDNSEQEYGYPQAVLTDLTLIEVTITPSTDPVPYVSTPVPNGACFHIASMTLDKPPQGWDCDGDPTGGADLALYLDGDCDCGCGVVDADCASAAGTECDNNECVSGTPDPADNSQCVTTEP